MHLPPLLALLPLPLTLAQLHPPLHTLTHLDFSRLAWRPTTPLQITNLTTQRDWLSNVTLTFDVHDPSPASQRSAHCAATWAMGDDTHPQTRLACDDDAAAADDDAANDRAASFRWDLSAWTWFRRFQLDIGSTFYDVALGDFMTTFSRLNVSDDVLRCETRGLDVACAQDPPDALLAEFWGAIA